MRDVYSKAYPDPAFNVNTSEIGIVPAAVQSLATSDVIIEVDHAAWKPKPGGGKSILLS